MLYIVQGEALFQHSTALLSGGAFNDENLYEGTIL